jgi:hypothetical protein
MPIQSKAGQRYERRFDPPARRVAPNGTQPFSVYTAPVVYNADFGQGDTAYFPVLTAPDDGMYFQLLLFGSDYPLIVRGTQQYGTDTYNEIGTLNAVTELTFAVTLGAGSTGFTSSSVPDIIPSTFDTSINYKRYQEIARGTTLTHGVTTAGFPVNTLCLPHNLYETASGEAGDRAPYTLTFEVVLNSGGCVGPSTYINPDEVFTPYLPVILYEPDFTQQVVDDGYKITANVVSPSVPGLPATLDVVGLWNVSGYVPPLAVGQGGLRRAAPLSDAPSLSLREKALAATANFRYPK